MTNLTHESRKQITESVVNKGTFLNEEKAAIKKSTQEAVRKAVLATLPKGFHDAIKNLPPEWFRKCSGASLQSDANPVALSDRKKYESERYPGNWRNNYTHIEFTSFLVPDSFNNRYNDPSFGQDWCEKHLAAQIDAAKKLHAKEQALRDELNAFLYSVKTYKQVLEKMPELESHLPAPKVKSYPVAVSTAPLVAKLADLGFDRSLKEA